MPPKFVPRQRKQKVRKRTAQLIAQHAPLRDSNAAELLPASKAEKDERRQRLREDLRAQQPPSKASSKKNKRLEKYIDLKLKKEENLDLLKKLANQKVDTSLFQSSKKLGRGHESKRERLGRALRERNAGIDMERNERILLETRPHVDEEDNDGNEVQSESSYGDESIGMAKPPATPLPVSNSAVHGTIFGVGLKRPLEKDEAGNSIIKRRKRTKLMPKSWSTTAVASAQDSDWEGFSSEVDAEDSTSDRSSQAAGESDIETNSMSEEGEPEDDDIDDSMNDDHSQANEATESSGDEDVKSSNAEKLKERSSAFKEWASQQRNDALGFVPSRPMDLLAASKTNSQLKNTAPEPQIPMVTHQAKLNNAVNGTTLSAVKSDTSPATARKVFNVTVVRPDNIQEARLALPVVAEEQKIMEAIHNHDIVIIWGATGSGKTTQVPQFLFEAGYGNSGGPTPGMIGVTQPRRVAAVSMAKRVSTELGDLKDKVAHQIRFDSTVSKDTSIKFMTDGVLLREIAKDFTLSKYSAIVLDEAHERSINTDLLIGMLSRIVETRADLAKKVIKYKPLKLVIMSATLRTADLTQNEMLFRKGEPPVIQAEGRQYPVTIHFTRRTNRDYLDEAFVKISRGHRKLPQGGILVFLTGQNEITTLSKRLKQTFASTDGFVKAQAQVRISAAHASIEDEDIELDGHRSEQENYDSDSDADIRGLDNDEDKEFDIGEDVHETFKVHVLPLYSQLPTDQQMRIFQPPPDGSRLIVLATNVAETSLTIPGIRYVFDCGRAKEKKYNLTTGVQSFEVGWISKASASQRSGRAGRTGPGHCYRLYSSAVYERDFAEFPEPEIARMPIEGVILQLKSIGIPNIANFPFPTPPDRESLLKAERLLQYLGALSNGKVTVAGHDLSLYPLSPRLSRMLCVAQAQGVAEFAITIVSALAVADIFVSENQLDLEEQETTGEADPWSEADNQEALLREKRRKEYNSFHGRMSRFDRISDVIKLLTTICDFTQNVHTDHDDFHKFTRVKVLNEIMQLRRQLTTIVATHRPGSVNTSPTSRIPEPTKPQIALLRQIVAAGYIDQVAIRADNSPNPPETMRNPKRAIDVPYTTLFPSSSSFPEDRTSNSSDIQQIKYVYIHPSSLLAHTSPANLPTYLIYSHLSLSSPRTISQSTPQTATTTITTSNTAPKQLKTRLHPLTPVTAQQLVALAEGTPLLEHGKPVGRIEALERDGRGRERRACFVVPFLKGEAGGQAWPMPPARRVVQVRVAGKGWIGEEEAEGA